MTLFRPVILITMLVSMFRPCLAREQNGSEAGPDIRKALTSNSLLIPGRTLVNARIVCSMIVDHEPYRIVDLIERVESQAAPRGYNRVIVFGSDMKPAFQLPYYPPAKPIGCHGTNLEFSDPVEINNTLPAGRSVSFMNGAHDATVLPDR